MKKTLLATLVLAILPAMAFADIGPRPPRPTPKPVPSPLPAPTPTPAPPMPPVKADPIAPAATVCFQLEAKAKDQTKEPQLLCIEQAGTSYKLRLTTGMPGSATEVAVFTFQLQSRARCIDCNQDVFALANPSNSVFNKLSIKFDGKRDIATKREKGTIKIGTTQFYYHSL